MKTTWYLLATLPGSCCYCLCNKFCPCKREGRTGRYKVVVIGFFPSSSKTGDGFRPSDVRKLAVVSGPLTLRRLLTYVQNSSVWAHFLNKPANDNGFILSLSKYEPGLLSCVVTSIFLREHYETEAIELIFFKIITPKTSSIRAPSKTLRTRIVKDNIFYFLKLLLTLI